MCIKNITKLMIVSAIICGVAFLINSDNGLHSVANATERDGRVAASVSESKSYIVSSKKSQTVSQLVNKLRDLGVEAGITRHFSLINAVEITLSEQQLAKLKNTKQFNIATNKSVKMAKTDVNVGSRIRQKESTIGDRVNATLLHQFGIRGNDVTIAVLDTGVRSFRSLRRDSMYFCRYFGTYDVFTEEFSTSNNDESGHGTHVASVAVNSNRDSKNRFYGIAPNANLVAVKAFNEAGMGTYGDVIAGLEWIVANKDIFNIRVLNLSFSATPSSHYWQDPLNLAVMHAWKEGIVVIASAGNAGPKNMTVGVPGNVPYIITVGAITDAFTPDDYSDDYIPEFSSQGPTHEGFVKPEIVAPGGHILGLMSSDSELAKEHPEYHTGNRYFEMSGTSQSAAVVSGVAALMLQVDPHLTPDEIKCKLISSAGMALTSQENVAYSVFRQGAGVVDAFSAILSPHYNCANGGMDIEADIAGESHYYGPADVTEKGEYYVHGMENMKWNQGRDIENAGGFLWRTAFLVDGGFLWRTNLESSGGFLWRTSFVKSSGGFLWRTSGTDVANVRVNMNDWVEQH